MKSAGKARNNGLYRHIRTSKEIIRNLLNDYDNNQKPFLYYNDLRVPISAPKKLLLYISSKGFIAPFFQSNEKPKRMLRQYVYFSLRLL